jgi:hypothetical protein
MRLNVLFLSLGLVTTVGAEEATRSPADLSEAERAQMVQAANVYAACLATEAQNRSPGQDDPRIVADAAMEACKPAFEDIGTVLKGLRLDPNFAEGFSRTSRDRAARRLLTVLMETKGQGN